MRILNLSCLAFVLTFTSCQTNKNVVISGELSGYKQSTAILYVVIPSLRATSLPDTIFADKNGRFSLELYINKPQIFTLGAQQDNEFYICPPILIQPGEKQLITCSLTKDPRDKKSISIKGPNSEGQMLFSTVDNGRRGLNAFNGKWNLLKSETLMDSLNVKIDRAVMPFQDLFNSKKIDSFFYEYSKNYIRYYFAFQLESEIEKTLSAKEELPQKEQLEKLSSQIFNEYPVSNNNIINSSVLPDYIGLYITYIKRINQKEYDDYASKQMTQTFELNSIKKIISSEAYKIFAIEYLWSRASWKDKETLDLFEQYKSEYPGYTKTEYYQMLEKESIPSIKELYALKDKQLQDGIVLLDKEKPVTSFNDLYSHFSGKPVFIDCWATWCGPCIEQFKFNNTLKEFLKKNGIEMVYIAFEKFPNREKWENFIKKYNLSGSHIMLNDSLKSDLYNRLGIDKSGFTLPKYILVNKTGQIVLKNALSPSDKEKLFEQIRTTLKY